MLRIERRGNGEIAFIVSGRLGADNVKEISTLLAAEATNRRLVLDLKDVVLVDRDVVRFLRKCENDGIQLRNCPPFVRAWMERERDEQ